MITVVPYAASTLMRSRGRKCGRKKKARSSSDRALPVCSAGWQKVTRTSHWTAELLKQLRVPQESHLRKLLTAAHTYSLNWSRITSTFC